MLDGLVLIKQVDWNAFGCPHCGSSADLPAARKRSHEGCYVELECPRCRGTYFVIATVDQLPASNEQMVAYDLDLATTPRCRKHPFG